MTTPLNGSMRITDATGDALEVKAGDGPYFAVTITTDVRDVNGARQCATVGLTIEDARNLRYHLSRLIYRDFRSRHEF